MNLSKTLLLLLLVLFVAGSATAAHPNFVWLVSEDNSKHYLQLFDPGGAPTPNLEALAAEGLIFRHAFSNSPVCSVARTTLATSCYGPRIGTQFHRRSKLAAMPPGLRMFPAYLNEAGYYTTNNSKKDYNTIEGENVWNDSSKKATWRNRPSPEQPFFHMQSFGESHESSLHFDQKQREQQTNTAKAEPIQLAEYHPDTELFRYTHARYLDRIQVIDQNVGKVVAELEAERLLEDTFIFYFGDHGGVLPRSKGYIYESGLHIPLIVRIPKNFRHLVDEAAGSEVNGFVSFIDFGPTLLHLAGLKVPEQVDGKPFLGPNISMEEVNARDTSFGYADRFDEKYDFCRSIRKGKFKYIRNYQPFLPDGLQNNYRYKMLAYAEWRDLYHAGKLSEVQSQFFQPKSAEALYDLESDPDEVHNLAASPEHSEVLITLREELRKTVKSLPDLSFYPESVLYDQAFDQAIDFGQRHQTEIAELVDTADLCLLPFAEAKQKLQQALTSPNPWIRYWGANASSSFGPQALPLLPEIESLLQDPERMVRLRAAEFLGITGAGDPRPILADILIQTDHPLEALLTLNTVVFFHDRTLDPLPFEFDFNQLKASKGEVERRIEYLKGKIP